MREDIKKRIEEMRLGKTPTGYQLQPRIGVSPKSWSIGTLSGVVQNIQRPIPKPDLPYWRLGIRSHAKGTFHDYVENPEAVSMDELYIVEENDLILNITFAWEHAIALAGKDDAGKLVSHRFPTYVFTENNSPSFFKNIVIQPRFKEMLANISPGGAGRNRVLNKKDFLQLPCYIPPVKEQQKIAKILNHCDKVIALKQELIEQEQNRKKWLMQNLLNPDSGFRLPGYSGEWEKIYLSKTGKFFKGRGISNEQCKTGTASCIKYGDIYMSYDEFFVCPVSFTEKEIAELSPMAQKGALLFTVSGEDRLEIGKATAYIGDAPLAVGGDIVVLEPNSKDFNSVFLAYQQYSDKLIKQKSQLAQGYSIVHLYMEQIKKLIILVPSSIEEQDEIANIIAAQDNKIILLEQELIQWQQKKKALMQLLLTGLVRVNI